MFNKTIKSAALFAVAAFAFASAASAEIRIAVVGPLTGGTAAFGEQMDIGAEQAVAEINGAGGVNGEKITLFKGDDRCEPKEAVAVANKIAATGIVFVAGHFCSGSSIPASEVYEEEGILQISPASTNPGFTENGRELVFRTVGRDDQQGPTAATWIANAYAGKRVAVVHDKQSYSAGLAGAVVTSLKAQGVTPVLEDTINPGEQDYSTIVAKLKNARADVLFYGGYHQELGLILRQMADQGYTPGVVGGDALGTLELAQIAGSASDGVMFTFPPDARKIAEARNAVEKIRSKYNYEPEGYTINTYATVKLWADVANKLGTTDPYRIAEYLRSGASIKTVVGDISFDGKGDLSKSNFVFYRWNNNNYEDVGANPAP